MVSFVTNNSHFHDVAGLGGVIVVLAGGAAAERDISLASGKAIYSALLKLNIAVELIDMVDGFVQRLLEIKPVFAFIAVHGRGGEDGVLQATLESLQIPYSGSPVLGSALAMDKIRSKCVWQSAGVPTAEFRYLGLEQGQTQEVSLDCGEIIEALGEKLFVKPANEGSSFGMSYVKSAEQLAAAIDAAKEFDSSILIEQFVDGPEYTQPILMGYELPAIRIETQREFYDYQAKYQDDDTGFFLPSGLSSAEELELRQLCLKAFRVVGCKGWGRVDVMRDRRSGQFKILEVNTVPGMTDHSLVPKSAAAVGMSFEDLVAGIINVALIERYDAISQD